MSVPSPSHTIPIPPTPSAKWQVREPEDRRFPVAHGAKNLLRLPDGSRILAVSRRGKQHAHQGRWREDAVALGELHGHAVLCLCDGAGSCELSREGARFASRAAVLETLAGIRRDAPASAESLTRTLQRSLRHAHETLLRHASELGYAPELFACTMILVILAQGPEGDLLGCGQVGDGVAAYRDADGEIRLLGSPETGQYAGESRFLTDADAMADLDGKITIRETCHPRMILAMTDGVADDHYPPLEGLVPLFDQMQALLADTHPDQALYDWTAYERIGSFDDRSIGLIVPAEEGHHA